ncbi:MAG: hypothetical protein K2M76_00340 [Muribaculaceae bacterium]|nr:hypothetical protein [Muribaculaceae bacterium]
MIRVKGLMPLLVTCVAVLCSCRRDEAPAQVRPDYAAMARGSRDQAVNAAREGNSREAVLAYSRAAYAGELAQDSDTAATFVFDDIAVAMRNAGLYRRSLELLDSLSVMTDVDSLFVDFSRGILLSPLLDSRQCDYDTVSDMGRSRYRATVNYEAGDMAGAMAWLDSVECRHADAVNDVTLLRALMSLPGSAQPTSRSIRAYTYLLHYQDSVLTLANDETMEIARRNALRAYGIDGDGTTETSRDDIWWWIVAVMVPALLAVTIAVIWIVRTRTVRARSTEQRLMAEIETLNDKLKVMAKDRFSTVNALCERFCPEDKDAAPRVNEKLKLTVYSRVKEILDGINSPSGRMRMEEWVNSNNDGIMSTVRHEMPQLSDDDMTLLMFLYAGLSSKSICMFLSITSANFYKRKQRLRMRIAESEAEHRDWFLNMLKTE